MDKKINIEEKFLLVDGISIHCTTAGKGRPLLLVHGLGGPLMWQRVIEPLSETFHVITVDLPGFGESDCPANDFSSEEYSEVLCHLLDQLNIQQISIAGISYGGQVAIMFAGRYPERIDKLILIANPGMAWGKSLFQNTLFWKFFSTFVKATILRSKILLCFLGSLSFYSLKSRPHDLCKKYFQQLSSPGKRNGLIQAIRNIYTEQDQLLASIKKLRFPVSILWGKQDRTVPVKFAYEFQRLIPNSSLTIFTECAHSAPLEKPAEVCEAIRSFSQQEKEIL